MLGSNRTFKPSFWARLFRLQNWKLALNRSVRDRISCYSNGAFDLPCVDISAITTAKGLLWHTVEIRTNDQTHRFSGLGATAASEIAAEVLAFINRYLSILIEQNKDQLTSVDQRIREITEDSRQYLAHADIAKAISKVSGDASRALSHPLFDPALLPESLRRHLPKSFEILTDPRVRQRYNENFVVDELARLSSFFDDLGGFCLSKEQREACIRLEDNNLLVASAGSGKSATMVGKVSYALEKSLYEPDQILVLAFNRSAAEELKERIARQLQVEEEDLECRVTTFHALGRAIIEEVEGNPPQLANWVEHPAGEARVIDQLIKDLMANDADFHRLWVDLLTVFQKADIPADSFDSDDDYRRYIADRIDKGAATVGTLAGVFVKSLQEKRIADWLWVNSVLFDYERQIAVSDADGSIRHVHPDFYYPRSETLHEHFAIDADGSSPFANYASHTREKRLAYERDNLDFFETTSAQAAKDTLLAYLEEELRKREIALERRNTDEIMKALEPVVIRHYHKLIAICIKHIRASHLSLEMLLERAKSLHDKPRAIRFAEAVWKISQAYSRKLDEEGRIDFDSMIGDAVRLVETGRYMSPYALIWSTSSKTFRIRAPTSSRHSSINGPSLRSLQLGTTGSRSIVSQAQTSPFSRSLRRTSELAGKAGLNRPTAAISYSPRQRRNSFNETRSRSRKLFVRHVLPSRALSGSFP